MDFNGKLMHCFWCMLSDIFVLVSVPVSKVFTSFCLSFLGPITSGGQQNFVCEVRDLTLMAFM